MTVVGQAKNGSMKFLQIEETLIDGRVEEIIPVEEIILRAQA